MTPKPSSNPSFIPDEGPYRTDPIRVANEALQIATEVRDSVKSDLKSLDKRVSELERNRRIEHGFFRTNWNSFWSFVSNVVQKIFSIELFIVAVIVSALSVFVWAMWSSSTEEVRAAREACQRANMTLVDSSNCRVTCIRPDSAVLVITTCGDDRTVTLTVPNQ